MSKRKRDDEGLCPDPYEQDETGLKKIRLETFESVVGDKNSDWDRVRHVLDSKEPDLSGLVWYDKGLRYAKSRGIDPVELAKTLIPRALKRKTKDWNVVRRILKQLGTSVKDDGYRSPDPEIYDNVDEWPHDYIDEIEENDEWPHLHMAVSLGLSDIVEMFLQNGVDAKSLDHCNRTALHVSAKFGYADISKILMRNDVDVNAVSRIGGETALHVAARYGKTDVVSVLIENGANVNAVLGDHSHKMPLHCAAVHGQADVVNVLIQNGADVNVVCFSGYSPLHIAATNGHGAFVRVLIENDAHLNIKTDSNETALELAASDGHFEVAKVLVENGANVSLYSAAQSGLVDVVERMIKNGVDKNNGRKNVTPLYIASVNGHVDVVKVLIQNGFDVNHRNLYGLTALVGAASSSRVEVVKVLIQSGADVNVVVGRGDEEPTTALSYAGSTEAVFSRHDPIPPIDTVHTLLHIVCAGARIIEDKYALDRTKLLRRIERRLDRQRRGRFTTRKHSLMCEEERRFMWNLAFSFTIAHRAAAFKAYYPIRSFITYHGIFMGPGYGLGDESIWNGGLGGMK